MGQRRVLVVDDSDADQFLSKLMIRRFDPSIQVLQAYDGREALAVLDAMEEPPDAVFLDINMPVMNGHEFLAALHERNATVDVFMLSSSAVERDKESSQAFDSVVAYCPKPLSVDMLAGVLSKDE